jgi:hypothetical protein
MAVTVTAPTQRSARTGRPGLIGVLGRRWPTGVGIAATTASMAVVAPLPDRLQGWLAAFGVLTAAVIYLAWGTARGELTDRRWLTAQTAAVLAFGAVAITAAAVMVVTPDAARYLLAAAWLAHAGWDAVHHRAGRVVPRWYAEACLACDVLLATALLLVGAL